MAKSVAQRSFKLNNEVYAALPCSTGVTRQTRRPPVVDEINQIA